MWFYRLLLLKKYRLKGFFSFVFSRSWFSFSIYIYINYQGVLTAQVPLTFSRIHPCRLTNLISSPAGILSLHSADECKFLLTGQLWYVHVEESLGERCLWVLPCFSISGQHVLLFLLSRRTIQLLFLRCCSKFLFEIKPRISVKSLFIFFSNCYIRFGLVGIME